MRLELWHRPIDPARWKDVHIQHCDPDGDRIDDHVRTRCMASSGAIVTW